MDRVTAITRAHDVALLRREGFSWEEIAELVDLPVSTCKRLARDLKKLDREGP